VVVEVTPEIEFLADTRYSGAVKRKILSSNAKALYSIR